MTFELPKLGYDYTALEPVIDAMTMEIHHQKHHGTYVTKLNEAVGQFDSGEKTIEDLLMGLSEVPEAQRKAVRNNGGGHYNHSLFWETIGPKMDQTPIGPLASAMESVWGSYDGFKEKFTEAAVGRFGSGWVWLYIDSDKKLMIGSTANQDNPLMKEADVQGMPLLGCDVWEHAYYLKYQNKRPDYVAAWYRVVNWEAVVKRYEMLMA